MEKGIDLRPEIASLRTEEWHWEGDTVVGRRSGKEAVVFSLLGKKAENYIALLIPGKTSEAVMSAMHILKAEFGDQFAQVFKPITVDNGSEFADFTQCASWGTQVFFAHSYTSWEQAQNERHNGLFRAFVPKGVSLQNYSAEYILAAADELKFISYYDNQNERTKNIDLTKPHKGVLPHTHHGYEHFENDSKKCFANLTAEEKVMVARARKLWYKRRSK